MVPEAIAEEVMAHSDDAARALDTVDWLERVPDATLTPRIAAWDLGPGESSVLSWALAHPRTVAVIDDYAARICAQALGLPIVGTLGLALRAKTRGEVRLAAPIVEELRKAGLYLSDRLIREALSVVGE